MNDPQPSSADKPPIDWHRIQRDPDFSALVRSKARLVIPATIFFIVYYFALPIGVGWFPEFMEKKIWGDMNIAYFFALSQFLMAWVFGTTTQLLTMHSMLTWPTKCLTMLATSMQMLTVYAICRTAHKA